MSHRGPIGPGPMANAAPLAESDLPEEFRILRRLVEARLLKMARREHVQVPRLPETFGLDDLPVCVFRGDQGCPAPARGGI